MIKKIKYFIFILVILPTFGLAAETNHIWVASSGGIQDAACRKLWNNYDQTFGATSIIMPIRNGLDGTINMTDLLDSPKSRKFMCLGISQFLNSSLVHPRFQGKDNQFQMIIQTIDTSTVWYVPNSTKVKTYKELIAYWKSLNRPISIGVVFPANMTVARHIEKTYNIPVNIINFKTGVQQFPALIDGTLDLGMDAGLGVSISKSGKFQIIGYHSANTFEILKSYPNFSNDDLTYKHISSWLGVVVPIDTNPEVKKTMAQRLQFIVRQPDFQEFATTIFGKAEGIIDPELSVSVKKQKEILTKYQE